MSDSNRIRNITISGAGGTLGTHLTHHLLSNPSLRITALTRPTSSSPLPPGLHAVRSVDPTDHASLVSALSGQDVLILTLASGTPLSAQRPLIRAAADAGVRFVMPNEYGLDLSDASLARDTGIGERALEIRGYVEEVGAGRMRWVALTSGFWYGFSLAGGEVRFGFDLGARRLTLMDGGETRICVSTWEQSARAIAGVLGLPVEREEGYSGPTVGDWGDKAVYVKSFVVSQGEMFESVLRVTGGRREDWEVRDETSRERFERGREIAAKGDVTGSALMAYARAFFPGGGGDYSHKVVNDRLGLPEEDLDEATRQGIALHEEGFWGKRVAAIAARMKQA